MRRPALTLLALLLCAGSLAGPARAGAAEPHDPVAGTAQDGSEVQIGQPASAAAEPVRSRRGRHVGRLLVERTGDDVRATVSFRGRPPERKVRLCLRAGGERTCVKRRPGADGAFTLEWTAPFTERLKGTARWGRARAVVRV